MINHYIMAHSQDPMLKDCVSSVLKSTKIPQRIIVVYNGKESVETTEFFKEFSEIDEVEVFYVGFNGFTHGLSIAIRKFQDASNNYYAVSDGDFIFPSLKYGDWLQDFITFLDDYPMVGRVGLGICLENLRSKAHLEPILEKEKKYLRGFILDEFYHAPIDTTPAVYRRDIFYWGDFIRPGHMTGMKPQYLSMRSKHHLGYHLGWDTLKYEERKPVISYSTLVSFGLFNGAFSSNILQKQSFLKQFAYTVISSIGRTYWRSRKLVSILLFLVRNRFVFLNELEKRFDDYN